MKTENGSFSFLTLFTSRVDIIRNDEINEGNVMMAPVTVYYINTRFVCNIMLFDEILKFIAAVGDRLSIWLHLIVSTSHITSSKPKGFV